MTADTVLLFTTALAVSTFLGYSLTAVFWPPRLSRGLIWAFAPGIGAGICSLSYFVFRRPMFTVELGLALMAILVFRYILRFEIRSMFPVSRWPPLLCAILFAALGLAAAGLLLKTHKVPHGDWDGWAIWATHARMLLRDGAAWPTRIQYTFHSDYPLMTPALTARLWRYAANEAPEAGGVIGMLFVFSAVAVVVSTVARYRGPLLAAIVGLVLLGTPTFLSYGTSQYADVPLSFFIVSTLALLYLHAHESSAGHGLLVLAGIAAGCAAWTKNEGLLFVLTACIALLAPVITSGRSGLRRFAWFAAGLLVPLAVIAAFKLTVPAQNDLLGARHDTLANLLNLDRHLMILQAVGTTVWTFGVWSIQPIIPLFAFIGLTGLKRDIHRDHGWRTGVLIFALMCAGYYAVYLATPLDLRYHLDSSLDRLLIQLWPAFLLMVGLAGRPRPDSPV